LPNSFEPAAAEGGVEITPCSEILTLFFPVRALLSLLMGAFGMVACDIRPNQKATAPIGNVNWKETKSVIN
jgi:hypothetical protein